MIVRPTMRERITIRVLHQTEEVVGFKPSTYMGIAVTNPRDRVGRVQVGGRVQQVVATQQGLKGGGGSAPHEACG